MLNAILHLPPQFLDLISSSGQWDQRSIETPIMLKEGYVGYGMINDHHSY